MLKQILAVISGFLIATAASAETYKFYLGNQPGTGPDTFVRKLTSEAEKISNHKFVVLNRPGGDFMVGYRAFVNDKSGKALFLSLLTTHVMPYVNGAELNIDPLNDTQPVIMGIRMNYLVVAPKTSSATSMKDIKPGTNIGYSGNLAPLLLSTLRLPSSVQFVPYKSDSEAALALMKGDIQFGQFISISAPRLYANDLKVIGNFDSVLSGFLGVHATSEMSTAEVYELNSIFNTVLSSKEFKEFASTAFGTTTIGGHPGYFERELNMYKRELMKVHRASVRQ